MGERLREGYTTGTCAAAAAAAAAKMLFTGKIIDSVDIRLPDGSIRSFNLVEQIMNSDTVCCGVIKDAGDDPDTTNGMGIYARARRNGSEIVVIGGKGIGVVTKPGLSVPVGEPAINPVPRKMIKDNVGAALPPSEGVEITIYAPEGIERAKKTFNEKLGIVGGISILGTTGIVRPMSLDSLKASLLPQVDIAKALGYRTVALVPGNMGARVAENKLKFPADAVIQMSNFVGFMLDYCAQNNIERVLLLGHIGKIAKVSGGYFDTHSSKTDNPVITMKRLLSSSEEFKLAASVIATANTAEDSALLLLGAGYDGLLEKIAIMASSVAAGRVEKRIDIGTAITVLSGDIVAMDGNARRIVGEAAW